MSDAMPLAPVSPIEPVATPPEPVASARRRCIDGRYPRDILDAIGNSFRDSPFGRDLGAAIVLVKGFDQIPDDAAVTYQLWDLNSFPSLSCEEVLRLCQEADQLPDRVPRDFYRSAEPGVAEAGTRAYGFDPSRIRPLDCYKDLSSSDPTSATHPTVLAMPPLDFAPADSSSPNAPAHETNGAPAKTAQGGGRGVNSNAPAKPKRAPRPKQPDQSHLPVREQILDLDLLPDIRISDQLARLVWKDHFKCNIPGQKDGANLARWHDGWFLWRDGYYREWTDAEFRNWMTDAVMDYFERDYKSRLADYDNIVARLERDGKQKRAEKSQDAKALKEAKEEAKPPQRVNVTTSTMNNMLQALASLPWVRLAAAQCDRQPAWRGDSGGHKANSMIVFKNGMIDVDDLIRGSNVMMPISPNLFSSVSIDFDYSTTPLQCPEWLAFLHESLSGEADSIALLQEFMGLCLTADNSHQKLLMLIGAPGSGKGTIINVIHALVGDKNYAGIKLRSLAKNFALAPLSGKAVACDPDVRLSVKDRDAILDTLLSITGDNPLSVEKKYKDAVNEKLVARFILGMNEAPDFGDSSGAMKRRILMLRFKKSFEKVADRNLPKRLAAEYPAILQWCAQGLQRLHRNGDFTKSESGSDFMETVIERNLVDDFADEHIEAVPMALEDKDLIMERLKAWCEEKSRDFPTDSWFWKKMRSKFWDFKESRKGGRGCRFRLVQGIRLVEPHAKVDPREWLDQYLKGCNGPVHRDQVIEAAAAVGLDPETIDMVADVTGVRGDAEPDSWSAPGSFSVNEDRQIHVAETQAKTPDLAPEIRGEPPF